MKALAKAIGGGSAAKKIKVDVPKPEPVTPIPDPEELRRQAMFNEQRKVGQGTGRISTLLTDDENKL